MIHKVIITGPVGSGKTTAVNSLGDGKAISTDTNVSDKATSKRKIKTTVAMDYSIYRLPNGDSVHLYGTPGQDRFDFMWDILSKGAHGLILLLDNNRKYPKRDLKHYTQVFSDIIENCRFIIGITRSDLSQHYTIQDYRRWVNELGIKADVMLVDPREKKTVEKIVHHLILSDPTLFGQYSNENNHSAQIETKATSGYTISEASFQLILKLKGVNGVAHSDAYGETIYSTLENEEMGNLIAFITGLSSMLEKQLNKGEIDKVFLRSPVNDNLSLFIEEGSSVGIVSGRKLSIALLSQQIEDILQWEE